jgi:hypothetical protein
VVGARLVVPIHYGVVGAEGYAEDLHAEQDLRAFARKRHIGVEVVKPGDWVEWRADA